MKRYISVIAIAAVMTILAAAPAFSQYEGYREGIDYTRYIKYDRYLDVEVWTDDDEYYDGENVTISFRADKDCYVVVYNIDTRGEVHLLYPADQWDDVKIERDRIYRIPDSYDDYELTVHSPEGIEYIQVIASQQPIPIPDWDDGWYLVAEGDPIDYIDYINAVYFACDDCLLSFDMTLFSVKEWNQAYFRPVHTYRYYDWDLCGTIYIDYPWGATVYIDGIYWGVAPLFIPRIYWVWHYLTIYDRYGYCWEDRINVYRSRTIFLDDTIIKTRSGVKSKYRDVRSSGYLNPAKNGYPEYEKDVRVKKKAMTEYKSSTAAKSARTATTASKYGDSRSSAAKSRTSAIEKHSSKLSRAQSSSGSAERKRSAVKERSSKSSSTARRYESTKSSTSGSGSATKSRSGSYDSSRKSSSSKSSSSSSGSYKRSASSSSSSSGTRSKANSSGSSRSSGGSSKESDSRRGR